MNTKYLAKAVEDYKEFCKEYQEPIKEFTQYEYYDEYGNGSSSRKEDSVDIGVLLFDINKIEVFGIRYGIQ